MTKAEQIKALRAAARAYLEHQAAANAAALAIAEIGLCENEGNPFTSRPFIGADALAALTGVDLSDVRDGADRATCALDHVL